MTDAYRTFSIVYREHNPSGQWKERKYIIAEFIARCWLEETPESVWNEICNDYSDMLEFGDRAIDDKGYCCYEDCGDTFFLGTLDDDDYTSNYSITVMKQGMKTFFPDIDYEFHWLTAIDGDVWDEITIVDNGIECSSSCWMEYPQVVLKNDARYLFDHHLIEEDEEPPKTRADVLKLKAFTIPEATEDNPHPVPRCVLVSEDEEEDYPPTSPKWFFIGC